MDSAETHVTPRCSSAENGHFTTNMCFLRCGLKSGATVPPSDFCLFLTPGVARSVTADAFQQKLQNVPPSSDWASPFSRSARSHDLHSFPWRILSGPSFLLLLGDESRYLRFLPLEFVSGYGLWYRPAQLAHSTTLHSTQIVFPSSDKYDGNLLHGKLALSSWHFCSSEGVYVWLRISGSERRNAARGTTIKLATPVIRLYLERR